MPDRPLLDDRDMTTNEGNVTGQAPFATRSVVRHTENHDRRKQMMRNIWKFGKVAVIGIALVAMVGAGSADAKRGGVGKTVEGSEVTDGTLTGADIDESSLQCAGPGGIPGCGAAGGAPAPLTTQLGTNVSRPIGYPAIKTATAVSTCPAGTKAVTGLVDILGAGEPDNVYLTAFGPTVDGTQFIATAKATSSFPATPAKAATLRVIAVCAG
jgi:hypothetical protein